MSVPKLAHIAVLSGDTERVFAPEHIGQAIQLSLLGARHGAHPRLRFCWDWGRAIDDTGLPYLCGTEFDVYENFRMLTLLISGFPLLSELDCKNAPVPDIEV